MNSAQTLYALGKREFLDGKTAYFYVPAFILGLIFVVMLLALSGVGTFDLGEISLREFTYEFEKMVRREGDNLPYHVTAAYWAMTIPAWMALPFVVYFGFTGALYEERKDRSILFFKSMPVADWQEVIAKLVTIGVVAPLAFVAVMIVAQLAFAVLVSLVILFNGGPVLELWPLLTMIESWLSMLVSIITYFFWALPLFAWILLASALAPKVPFLFAAVPPVVLTILEAQLFGHTVIGDFIVDHLGRGFAQTVATTADFGRQIDGPDDILDDLSFGTSLQVLFASLGRSTFWIGLVAAAGLLFGAIEVRRRAS